MADTKISALPASTTPLDGTEVLPIVQGGATVKVSVANLTAGRAVSATQMTLTTGNLIVASGQGIDFSATPGTGTSELLADYEEGTWTPELSFGGGSTGLTYFLQTASYTKIGNRVYVTGRVYINAVGSSTGSAVISGLPFTVAGSTNYDIDNLVPAALWQQALLATIPQARLDGGTTTLSLWSNTAGASTALTQLNFQTFTSISFAAQYVAA